MAKRLAYLKESYYESQEITLQPTDDSDNVSSIDILYS